MSIFGMAFFWKSYIAASKLELKIWYVVDHSSHYNTRVDTCFPRITVRALDIANLNRSMTDTEVSHFLAEEISNKILEILAIFICPYFLKLVK